MEQLVIIGGVVEVKGFVRRGFEGSEEGRVVQGDRVRVVPMEPSLERTAFQAFQALQQGREHAVELLNVMYLAIETVKVDGLSVGWCRLVGWEWCRNSAGGGVWNGLHCRKGVG